MGLYSEQSNAHRCRASYSLQGAQVVKIGSTSLVDEHGSIRREVMESIAAQCAALHRQQIPVILVASGVMATGRAALGADATRDAIASEGQRIMNAEWSRAYSSYDIDAFPLYVRESELGALAHMVKRLVAFGVPIVNGDDRSFNSPRAVTADNDRLAMLLSASLGVERLIFLTGARGVLDRDGGVMQSVTSDEARALAGTLSGRSSLGTGGIASKLQAAAEASDSGIEVVICSAFEEGTLLLANSGVPAGTLIKARSVQPIEPTPPPEASPRSSDGALVFPLGLPE